MGRPPRCCKGLDRTTRRQEGGAGMHWKGGGGYLLGPQPMPSHCPPDAKCQLPMALATDSNRPNRFGNLLQPPV